MYTKPFFFCMPLAIFRCFWHTKSKTRITKFYLLRRNICAFWFWDRDIRIQRRNTVSPEYQHQLRIRYIWFHTFSSFSLFSLVSPFTPPWCLILFGPRFVTLRYSACRSTQFETQDGSSDSTLSPYTESLASSSHVPMSSPNYSTSPSYSPSQQNYPIKPNHHQPPYYPPYRHYENPLRNETIPEPVSPELLSPTNLEGQDRMFGSSLNVNASNSPQLSPIFKSEAAKQIIKEMTEKKIEGPRRRQIPREKRRHYTVSSSKPILDLEDTFSKMVSFIFVFYVFIFLLVAFLVHVHSFNFLFLFLCWFRFCHIFVLSFLWRRFVVLRVSLK